MIFPERRRFMIGATALPDDALVTQTQRVGCLLGSVRGIRQAIKITSQIVQPLPDGARRHRFGPSARLGRLHGDKTAPVKSLCLRADPCRKLARPSSRSELKVAPSPLNRREQP